MRPLVYTGRHRPHEVALLLWSLLFSILSLAGVVSLPPSLHMYLPGWGRDLWLGLLLVGGSTGLAGIWTKKVAMSLTLERAGMTAVAAAFGIFAAQTILTNGAPSIGGAGFLAAMAVASVWRISQICRDLAELRRYQFRGER